MNDCQEFNQHIMHDNDMSDDSEAEHEGEVNISDDQRRAMIELVAQKREHGHFSGTVKPGGATSFACQIKLTFEHAFLVISLSH